MYLVVYPSGAPLDRAGGGQRPKEQEGRAVAHGLWLGGADVVTLNQARDRALEYRRMAKQGLNPRFNVRQEVPTFEEVAQQVHIDRMPTWKKPSKASSRSTHCATMPFPRLVGCRLTALISPK
ncbi:hypothetical protein [Sulfitobacter sp. MF3-043]|uniref:Arm DNA-binding domain-containing protein n=1 Tax=Sulfitobacter sediminivivens TaxID=3252902 RepID=UPI003EBF57A5